MNAVDQFLLDTAETAGWIAAAYRAGDDVSVAVLMQEAAEAPVPEGAPPAQVALLGALVLAMAGDVPLARRRFGAVGVPAAA